MDLWVETPLSQKSSIQKIIKKENEETMTGEECDSRVQGGHLNKEMRKCCKFYVQFM